MALSTCLATPESLENHFARSGQGFLSMRREYGQHAAQERRLPSLKVILGPKLDN